MSALDGVFGSELGVILMQERGPHEETRKKGRRKKYLMQVGSTCQGFGGADEAQLVRVFESLAETNGPALTH